MDGIRQALGVYLERNWLLFVLTSDCSLSSANKKGCEQDETFVFYLF